MKVKVKVSEVSERHLGLMTVGHLFKEYVLEMEPVNVLAEYEEARQVWSEYDVQFEGIDDAAAFRLCSVKTYSEEMRDRQELLDLHEELAEEGELFDI